MAVTSFKKQAKPETEAIEVSAEIAPANTQLAAPTETNDNGIQGEISRSDIKLPRINLVQKVGDLSNLFTPGIFLFDKSIVLSEGKVPFEITVLHLKKMYQEDLDFTSKETPQSFDTADEVIAAGGSLKSRDANYYKEVAHVQVVIEKPKDCPEELEGLFPYEFEGKQYGSAIWTLTGSAFTNTGKTLITAAFTLLRAGLHTGKFLITSELKKNEKNSWYAPIAKFGGKHTPEQAEFFKSLK
jgi:hypothetical protein